MWDWRQLKCWHCWWWRRSKGGKFGDGLVVVVVAVKRGLKLVVAVVVKRGLELVVR